MKTAPNLDNLPYCFARLGLLTKEEVDLALPGEELVRGPCPVHGGDNPTAFTLRADAWFCQTNGCHRLYGHTLKGLVVALCHRYAHPAVRPTDRHGHPFFGEARAWLYRNERKLRLEFAQWESKRTTRSGGGRSAPPFSCSREAVLDSLLIPDDYFQTVRGFSADVLRQHLIGRPVRGTGVFSRFSGHTIVPLFDLDGPVGAAKCVGFMARNHTDPHMWKWRKSRDLPPEHALFGYRGACQANLRGGARLLLVEGVPDALKCIEAGYPAVAALGSNLSNEQVDRLSRLRLREVVVVAHNDESGGKFADQVRDKMAAHAAAVRVVHPPSWVKDVGELSSETARAFLAASVGRPSGVEIAGLAA